MDHNGINYGDIAVMIRRTKMRIGLTRIKYNGTVGNRRITRQGGDGGGTASGGRTLPVITFQSSSEIGTGSVDFEA